MEYEAAARSSGRPFLPIYLSCDVTENLRRVTSLERASSGTKKLTSGELLKDMRSRCSLFCFDTLEGLRIDTSHLLPAEAAMKVLAYINLQVQKNELEVENGQMLSLAARQVCMCLEPYFLLFLSNGGAIRHSYMPADQLTTVLVLLPLRPCSAKVLLSLEPCPAYTVQLRLSKLANRNRHWSYTQQQHLESSITLPEASGQYLNTKHEKRYGRRNRWWRGARRR